MTIKQQMNHGPFKKYFTCLRHFSSHSPISHFVSFTLTPHLYYLPKITNYGMREKRFSVYMAASAYHVISKEVKNPLLIK